MSESGRARGSQENSSLSRRSEKLAHNKEARAVAVEEGGKRVVGVCETGREV